MRTYRPGEHSQHAAASARSRLLVATLISSGLCALVLLSAWGDDTPLGAPRYWPWLLTGLQVLALWSAGSRRWWGWLLGGSVQLPWIAYAVMTSQLGFIPGCAISASVQIHSFLQSSPVSRHRARMGDELNEVPVREGKADPAAIVVAVDLSRGYGEVSLDCACQQPPNLCAYSQTDLDAIAGELTGRPRQTLEFITPSREVRAGAALTP